MNNETEKAARLSKRVVEEIEKMTTLLSQEIGLDPKWVPNEIVFQATKIVRDRMYEKETTT